MSRCHWLEPREVSRGVRSSWPDARSSRDTKEIRVRDGCALEISACVVRSIVEAKDVVIGSHTGLGVVAPAAFSVADGFDALVEAQQGWCRLREVWVHPVLVRPAIASSKHARVTIVPVSLADEPLPSTIKPHRRGRKVVPACPLLLRVARCPSSWRPEVMEAVAGVCEKGGACCVTKKVSWRPWWWCVRRVWRW